MMEEENFDADEWLRSFWPAEWVVAEPPGSYGQPHRPRNPVVEETFDLASRVMDYAEVLEKRNATFADQILRSGTSVGSHTREGQGAESLADFHHKMKIAHKELEETDYRLALCHLKAHYPHDPELVARTKRLFPLFNSILSTTKQRLNQQRKRT
ncbi:MAG: four helix bundle protein [Flavobacteriales bacterium]|nr:four helix bundle protein [Flavobacteriales bacterium]